MRITVHIEQVKVEGDRIWGRSADALAAHTASELARLIARTGISPDVAARAPGVVAVPEASSTGVTGEPIPRQLAVAVHRALGSAVR